MIKFSHKIALITGGNRGLGKNMALRLADHGADVILTYHRQNEAADFTKAAFEANPQVKEMIASQTALGRVGVADDIGGVVAFLCSEDGRWVNGQRIEASAGIFL